MLEDMDRSEIAIKVDGVKKKFLLYHEKHETLKETILAGRRAKYTELWALDGVSFDFKKGRTYGIIGENGSGKSTLLKMITRILRPDAGCVEINGRISALLELGAGFHQDLTGRENIYLNGAIMRLSREEIDAKFDEIVEFSEIGEFIDTAVKNYSSGMYMRLGFAIAVNVDPDILLIDEVLAVGDESFQRKCFNKLESIQNSGKTIVFVSHDVESVRRLCDQAILIHKGKIVDSGDVNAVVDKYHAMLSSRETAESEAGQAGQRIGRYGSFEGQIIKCGTEGADNRERKTFKQGDTIVLRLTARFDDGVSRPIIGFIISKADGTHAYSTNTQWRGLDLGEIAKGTDIDLVVRMKAHLVSGDYTITTAIADTDGSRFYDWWEQAVKFKIEGDTTAQGTADLEADLVINRTP